MTNTDKQIHPQKVIYNKNLAHIELGESEGFKVTRRDRHTYYLRSTKTNKYSFDKKSSNCINPSDERFKII